jgi:hypothetical protein
MNPHPGCTRRGAAYRQELRARADWTPYLIEKSGLPGPRGNLELAHAAAQEDPLRLESYLAIPTQDAPENTPQVFLVFCGVLGLGVRLARGEAEALPRLRRFAGDPRWRVREAVATALQLWGDIDLAGLVAAMVDWSGGGCYERRAAVAALCEPRLLKDERTVSALLDLLDRVTAGLEQPGSRQADDFQALRKTLGYGWSVAVAASPAVGKPRLERWIANTDRDVRWVVRENFKKNRLLRLDPDWVGACRARLG